MQCQYKNWKPHQTAQRGFTLLECLVAIVLLGAAMSVVVPMIKVVDKQRAAADRALIRAQEASNILEQVTSWNFRDITQQKVEEYLQQNQEVIHFENAKWQATIEDSSTDEKSIHLTLVNNKNNTVETELLTWVYSN